MSPIFVIFCLCALAVRSEFIGSDCERKNDNLELIGGEKLDIFDITRECPVFIESECDQKYPCTCQVV